MAVCAWFLWWCAPESSVSISDAQLSEALYPNSQSALTHSFVWYWLSPCTDRGYNYLQTSGEKHRTHTCIQRRGCIFFIVFFPLAWWAPTPWHLPTHSTLKAHTTPPCLLPIQMDVRSFPRSPPNSPEWGVFTLLSQKILLFSVSGARSEEMALRCRLVPQVCLLLLLTNALGAEAEGELSCEKMTINWLYIVSFFSFDRTKKHATFPRVNKSLFSFYIYISDIEVDRPMVLNNKFKEKIISWTAGWNLILFLWFNVKWYLFAAPKNETLHFIIKSIFFSVQKRAALRFHANGL